MKSRVSFCGVALLSIILPVIAGAQGTVADYERSNNLRSKYQGLIVNIAERANWIGDTSRFWYRKSVKGGYEFVLFDAETLARKPAFDHARLAASFSAASGDKKVTALTLPFPTITFVDQEQAIEFIISDVKWKCDLTGYSCTKSDAPDRLRPRGGLAGPRYTQSDPSVPSPDKKWEAYINNYNVYIRATGQKKDVFPLSLDGSEGNYYMIPSTAWSPDSQKLVVYRVRPGFRRKIHHVESSPGDQVQPKYSSMDYAKPGDALDIPRPVLFLIESKKQLIVDDALFSNPYEISRPEWRNDSRSFTFEYNQRGHQVFRVIEIDAATGTPRAVISEEPKTFFSYSGKKYRRDLQDSKEIIWMSERDGWNHLYLYDGVTGKVKNQITKGNWVVRSVEKVDEVKRQVWFQASSMYPGKDPYFIHYYRINFDGTGLIALTEGDGNHLVSFSKDMKFYVDMWSRVDQPPVSQLRRTDDSRPLAELERGNIDELLKAGWRAPEVFSALGRDGTTEIWGVIYRPTNFDPLKKYPVVEYIYAGPHSSFVPKSFSVLNERTQYLAELGFIVVQIDGMGTSNRSKAFHDVAWKNLGDAGFPDRILWHKAVAAKYPYY
ncbi:MAG: S9 family peptidase, partial [Acidobacteria bacterium]|nr:S9 family peptidase [Acidobacteriota bacterium]